MTLTADENTIRQTRDRRAATREPRRSWASLQPYEPRAPRVRTDQSPTWTRISESYVRSTVLVDLAIVSVVGLALTYGYGAVAATWSVAAAAAFAAVVATLRGYSRRALGSGSREFQAPLQAAAVLGLVLVVFEYATHHQLPRRLVFVGLPLVVLLTWLDRHRRRTRLHHARRTGVGMQRALVVGSALEVSRLVPDLRESSHDGLAPVGACLPNGADLDLVGDVDVLGSVSDVVQVVVDQAVDVVLVTSSILSGGALRRLSWALGRLHVQLVVVPDLEDVSGPRLSLRPVAGMPLLEVEVGAERSRLVAKSVLDRVLGGLILLAASPVILVAAVLVARTSPGGAFFRQPRVGIDGQLFTMWKLRTMYEDAEKRRQELLAASDGQGLLFKMHDDPRVTPVGKFLRRYSIDELPQLWNVVRGDMSLVGPRPPLVEEVAAYSDPVTRRLHVRPGLTGLWQVSGRSDLSWEASVALDLRYVDNWSLAGDLLILWKTARAVLRGSGAY
ncbi:sugar transferase [Cellulomonas endophytica]|uniref:sugar transferase n=1 Tax=Cellulomonas endophytica TaxID=2494735 RepID=UPI0010135415|nr:sugar transferase [Cellulomonas endophytica]